MKHTILFFCVLLFCRPVFAQKGVDGLVRAEKSFAAYAGTHSTKEAFLAFSDSAGIMFDEGKAVNTFKFWEKREKTSGLLYWWPRFAEVSSSGDFGFTMGPWNYSPKAGDTAVSFGLYSTVWHIDKNGEWKFLVDLGVSNSPLITDTTCKRRKISETIDSLSSLEKMLETEKSFIRNTALPHYKTTDRKLWYKTYFTDDYWSILCRNKRFPATESYYYSGVFSSMTFDIVYQIDGYGLAPSGDMGYVYGTTVISGKTDNYLRVWRLEKNGWKIALEVLRY